MIIIKVRILCWPLDSLSIRLNESSIWIGRTKLELKKQVKQQHTATNNNGVTCVKSVPIYVSELGDVRWRRSGTKWRRGIKVARGERRGAGGALRGFLAANGYGAGDCSRCMSCLAPYRQYTSTMATSIATGLQRLPYYRSSASRYDLFMTNNFCKLRIIIVALELCRIRGRE